MNGGCYYHQLTVHMIDYRPESLQPQLAIMCSGVPSVLYVLIGILPLISCNLEVVPRAEWGARPPFAVVHIASPVDTVVIHHTEIPGACNNSDQCKQAMRSMQNYHMDTRGWDDIGYNFAVGWERVYEGRGWGVVGAHAPHYNNHSVGIALIGNYSEEEPTEIILSLTKQLIQLGLKNGSIRPDYQLVGHRQVRDTDCPGDALYQLVKTWDHWAPDPK